MSSDSFEQSLHAAVVHWTQDSASPVFDVNAIRQRALRRLTPPQPSRPRRLRMALAICVILAALAVAPSVPAILSSMTRTFHAFAIGNGRVQTARTRAVTLEQARKDMPFAVLAPAGLPPSFRANITEVYPSAKRADAQLWFDFSAADPGKAVTILEMAASSPYAAPAQQAAPPSRPGEVVVTQTQNGKHLSASAITIGAPSTCVSMKFSHAGAPLVRTMCEPPAVGGRGPLVVSSGGEHGASLTTATGKGTVLRSAPRLPIRWIAHGTLVILFDPASVLSRQQVDALQATMSR